MKKSLITILTVAFASLTLAACGSSTTATTHAPTPKKKVPVAVVPVTPTTTTTAPKQPVAECGTAVGLYTKFTADLKTAQGGDYGPFTVDGLALAKSYGRMGTQVGDQGGNPTPYFAAGITLAKDVVAINATPAGKFGSQSDLGVANDALEKECLS
jgi:hypothetical protein